MSKSESISRLKLRRRQDYPYMLEYRTRWNDNDMYQHLNNSIYNNLFDSIINDYLMTNAAIVPSTSAQYGLAVHSHADFLSSMAYPAVAEAGLRVVKLGRSSVTYEVGVFAKGEQGVKAVGEFVHVFVDRATGRPVEDGAGTVWRSALERIHLGPVDPSSRL